MSRHLFFSKEKLRFPSLAGEWYSGSKRELNKEIDKLLNKVKSQKIEGEIFGILVPHASYSFSGTVAASAYKVIENRYFETVVLIGDSHYEYFQGVSVWDRGEWITPLGKVKIDEVLARELLKFSKRFFVKDSVHLFEHALEVQLPFLQKVLKNFRILPLIFGSENKDWKILAKAILKLMKRKKILVLASTDLSHYPPCEIARKVDSISIQGILSSDPYIFEKMLKRLGKNFSNIETFVCSKNATKTILQISKTLNGKATLLKYLNSGDILKSEKKRAVGYASICFYL